MAKMSTNESMGGNATSDILAGLDPARVQAFHSFHHAVDQALNASKFDLYLDINEIWNSTLDEMQSMD